MNETPIRRKVIVHGRVQGVGFRWATVDEATRLGLAGHARNLDDGGVEVDAQGATAPIETFLKWLEHGPATARVDRMEVHALEPDASVLDFRVAH